MDILLPFLLTFMITKGGGAVTYGPPCNVLKLPLLDMHIETI